MTRLLTLLAIAVVATAQVRVSFAPVALAVLADGNLVVLSADHLALVEPAAKKKRVIASLPVAVRWIDVAAMGSAIAPRIFLVGHGANQQTSFIAEYDGGGKQVRRWRLPYGYPAGIAVDSARQTLT